MNDNSYIYSAYYSVSKSEAKFLIDKIRVVKVHDDGIIELDAPYFTSATYSTNHFVERDFDREIILSDSKFLFYSRELIKCRGWLTQKRKKHIAELEEELNALKQANKIGLVRFSEDENTEFKL